MNIVKITTKKYGEFMIDKASVISLRESNEIFEALESRLKYNKNDIEKDIKNKKEVLEDINISFDGACEYDDVEAAIPFTSQEYLSCKVFTNNADQNFPLKLKQYYHWTDYFNKDKFVRITDGLGNTSVFRNYLKRYIKEFEPVEISEDKRIFVCIEKDGEFRARVKQNDDYADVVLSECEQTIFRFICYLKVNEFWEKALELKEVYTPNMPLLVCNLFEMVDKSPNVQGIIATNINKYSLQTIVFTS